MITASLSLCLVLLFSSAHAGEINELRVGSKKFTESVILGEIARVSLEQEGFAVEHKKELGGTRILWNALLSGDIDVYADYSGTLTEEILQTGRLSFDDLQSQLKKLGIGATRPIGFNNTYAVGMRSELAKELGIKKISDLRKHPDLKMGWGEEFRLRRDGWLGLKEAYKLPHQFVRGMDHDIGYRALQTGDIEIMDLYSTDAEIAYYDLFVLADDLSFFPSYEALYLYRLDMEATSPKLSQALHRLSGKIDDAKMIELNSLVKIDKVPSGQVATDFLNVTFGWESAHRASTRMERMLVRTKEHLLLVFVSLFFAILIAVPLGVLAEKWTRAGQSILWTVGIIQTIPALALLVMLIRPLNLVGLSGVGDTPALIALFLYSLLPIVRSTHTGVHQIPTSIREATSILNLRPSTKLWKIELPLALPYILSGIKTSAVMNVGFATLGALVGAGGYGQPILTGIRLDDYALILEGAIPSAVLALIVQQFFESIGNKFISPGLK